MKTGTSNRGTAPEHAAYYWTTAAAAWGDAVWLASACPLPVAAPAGIGTAPGQSCCDRQATRVAADAAYRAACAASGREMSAGVHVPVFLAAAEGRGIAAVSRAPDRRIGLALDRAGAMNPRYADCFATPRERALCPFADPTVLWTLKEAAWKAFPEAPSSRFRELQTLWTRHGHPCGLSLAGVETPAHFLVLTPWPGWILSAVMLSYGRE